MGFDTFIPEVEGFQESMVLTEGQDEHPDERAQRMRHAEDHHKMHMKHEQETHDQNKRHRDEAHKHNLKKAHDNDFAYAPAVYAYGGRTECAHFTSAGESPNAGPAGSGGTTSDTPSASGGGVGGGAAGGAGGAGGGAA